MRKIHITPAMLIIASLVGGCGSMATSTSMLEQVRADYASAQNDPKIVSYAPAQLQDAGAALMQANQAAGKNASAENVNRLAYLAKQKLALTQEVAKQKEAEAQVAGSAKERDQIRLAQRTNEAERATADAARAKMASEAAQQDAMAAQQDAAAAQRQAQDATARAARLEDELQQLAAKKTERGIVITLGDVLFATDDAKLNSRGIESVRKLSQVLQENPQRTVLIEGFTDSTGSSAHNLALSEKRAGSVRDALQQTGIESSRIAIRGYGEANPVAGNDTAANRQLNRRVEIVLSDEQGKIASR